MKKKTKLVWNREIKKLILGFMAFWLLGLGAVNMYMTVSGYKIRREYIEILEHMAGNVLYTYPDVDEEELVKGFFEQNNEGEEILARYGIFREYGARSFLPMERQMRCFGIALNSIVFLLSLGAVFMLLRYFKRRQQRIAELETYMEMLNSACYKLEIEDNDEDELSGLRNEIYKLTVFLKEQAQKALAQKSALADSLADISHQLKTPLTSVTVLMDNLMEDGEMDSLVRSRFMSEITYQLMNMSWLITAILKISRLEAGVVEMERESMQLREIAEEAMRRVEVAAEWSDVSFSINISEDIRLCADKNWTAEALANILKNAVEHSMEGGCVFVSGEENDVYVQISIWDLGEGMTGEERKKLFSRFYNGSSAREDSIGIGLALAKEIIEKQDGSIAVDSEKGRGTKFKVRFLK